MSYAAGYRLARAGSYERSKDFLLRAIALLPSEPLYHDEMSTTLAALTTAAIEDSKNATRAAELAQAAMQESDRALTVSPKNVNFWKSRTKILYSFSSFNPELNKTAIDALKNAQMLSPTDPKIAYNLAILWGREGDNGQAIDLLKQAIDLKPNYRDAYYALFVFYTDTGQIPVARAILTQYLTDVDPKDQDFQDKLKQL
jgi:tetratricopeptide (TPR) repeat protein